MIGMIHQRMTSLQVFISQRRVAITISCREQEAINLGYCVKVKKDAFAFYLHGTFSTTTLEMHLLILYLFYQIAQTISILNLFTIFYNINLFS